MILMKVANVPPFVFRLNTQYGLLHALFDTAVMN